MLGYNGRIIFLSDIELLKKFTHEYRRGRGIGNTEGPSKYHPCIPAVLIEAHFQRGS